MTEIEDKEWLALLAGRSISTKDANQIRNVEALRGAIKKFNAEELAQSDGLKKLMSRMASEGLFLELGELSFFKKLIRFVKKIRIFLILIIGIIAGLMAPMQLAIRGVGDNPIHFEMPKMSDSKVETEITITNKNPLMKAQEITISAISAGLSVTTEKHGDVIHLTIKGFTKMNPDLIPINSILRLSNQTQGNVSVLIKEG